MFKTATTKVVPAGSEQLEKFSRDDLREYANDLGIETGRSKEDTIRNLIASGKATLCASLGN